MWPEVAGWRASGEGEEGQKPEKRLGVSKGDQPDGRGEVRAPVWGGGESVAHHAHHAVQR